MSFNVSLDDSSPLITYSPSTAWIDTPDGDILAAQYSSKSLHTTSQSGATASFTFNGTGVWLYGAHRPTYGGYSLSVDGNVVTNESAAGEFAASQLLGGASGLSDAQHVAVLTNSGGSYIDLDSLVFEAQLGSNESAAEVTLNDNDPTITYGPSASDWSVLNDTAFKDGSTHYTQTSGEASLTFSGDAVAVFGMFSPDHAPYSVTLDGKPQNFGGGSSGHARVFHSQTVLYFAGGLSSTDHNLVITAEGQGGSDKFMDIDSITLFGSSSNRPAAVTSSSSRSSNSRNWASQSGNVQMNAANTPQTNPASAVSSTKSSSGMSKGAIIGIVVGVVVGALLIICLLIFIFMRRRAAIRKREAQLVSPVLPFQYPDPESAYGSEDDKVGPLTYGQKFASRTSTIRKSLHLNGTRPLRLARKSTTASQWSQDSHATLVARAERAVSGMPDKEARLPRPPILPPPMPLRPSSSFSIASDDSGSLVDLYRHSYQTTVAPSPAPTRPARPPGLEHVNLDL